MTHNNKHYDCDIECNDFFSKNMIDKIDNIETYKKLLNDCVIKCVHNRSTKFIK